MPAGLDEHHVPGRTVLSRSAASVCVGASSTAPSASPHQAPRSMLFASGPRVITISTPLAPRRPISGGPGARGAEFEHITKHGDGFPARQSEVASMSQHPSRRDWHCIIGKHRPAFDLLISDRPAGKIIRPFSTASAGTPWLLRRQRCKAL
jgi:hypothetical protein